jgi:hypothetical protein
VDVATAVESIKVEDVVSEVKTTSAVDTSIGMELEILGDGTAVADEIEETVDFFTMVIPIGAPLPPPRPTFGTIALSSDGTGVSLIMAIVVDTKTS